MFVLTVGDGWISIETEPMVKRNSCFSISCMIHIGSFLSSGLFLFGGGSMQTVKKNRKLFRIT